MFVVPRDEPDDCRDPDSQQDFFPKAGLTGSLFITVEEVDMLWEAVRDKVVIKTALADREYWMRDFSMLDNNGYELVFGEDISSRKQART